MRNQADKFGQVRGDRQAALVIQARARDSRAMNLRFEEGQLHRLNLENFSAGSQASDPDAPQFRGRQLF